MIIFNVFLLGILFHILLYISDHKISQVPKYFVGMGGADRTPDLL